MNPIQTLSDEALLLKLQGDEHDFVERKPLGQQGEWLQVAVAFANSAPMGWPAVLFIGANDKGEPQEKPEQLKRLSDSLVARLNQVYPPIYCDARPVHVGDKACLAVIIPGSTSRPHFAGQAYVRIGDQVQVASEQQFAELIASHSSKARMILEWKGKAISAMDRHPQAGDSYHSTKTTVVDCNSHFATFKKRDGDDSRLFSESLSRIELDFDHRYERLMVVVYKAR